METFATILGIYVVLCIVAIPLWVHQFVQLMLLGDSDFPGRNDKILWAAMFICSFIGAPLAFLYWKMAYISMRGRKTPPDEEEPT